MDETMNRPEGLEKVSRAKTTMDLLTSRTWRYQRLIDNGKEQSPPNHLVEFRKDGKYIEHRSEGIVECPWELSDSGRQIIINWGRTSTRILFLVSESKLILKGRTSSCIIGRGGRFEATMVAVEEGEQVQDAV
jgi:hypothetical protein